MNALIIVAAACLIIGFIVGRQRGIDEAYAAFVRGLERGFEKLEDGAKGGDTDA